MDFRYKSSFVTYNLYKATITHFSPFIIHTSAMVLRVLSLLALSAIARGNFILNGNECLVVSASPASGIEPCLCPPASEQLLDLGRGHYPRYLVSLSCEPNRCLKPPYVCTSLPYKSRVLKHRDVNGNSRPDVSLPKSLQDEWEFVHIPVVVACVCSV